MPAEEIHVAGHCYCGEVRFEVHLPAGEDPFFTEYCHCDSCRRAHAAPLYYVVCVDSAHFTFTAGEQLLTHYTRPSGRITRTFCASCGSTVLNILIGWNPEGKKPLMFFPNLLEEAVQQNLPEAFRPGRHMNPKDCVLDFEMIRQLMPEASH